MELLLQQIINGLVIGSTYAVLAAGFALVFSVMRVVNLAHPDFFMVGMFVAIGIGVYFTDNLIVIVIGVSLTVAALALVLERLVLRPLRSHDELMPIVATAGVALAAQNIMAGIVHVDPVYFPPLLPTARYTALGLQVSLAQLVNVGLAMVMVGGLAWYVKKTKWGRATRAVAENPDVAASVGVNVTRMNQITIVIAAVLAGIAGLSIGNMYTSAWAFISLFYTLKAFIVMLVAGNRHLEGILVVGLVLGLVEVLVTGYVSSNFRDAIAFPAMLAVLFFRPKGLFGSY